MTKEVEIVKNGLYVTELGVTLLCVGVHGREAMFVEVPQPTVHAYRYEDGWVIDRGLRHTQERRIIGRLDPRGMADEWYEAKCTPEEESPDV